MVPPQCTHEIIQKLEGWRGNRKEERSWTLLTGLIEIEKSTTFAFNSHSLNLSTFHSCHSNTCVCQQLNLGNADCIIWWSLNPYETQMGNCTQKEGLSSSVPTTTILIANILSPVACLKIPCILHFWDWIPRAGIHVHSIALSEWC